MRKFSVKLTGSRSSANTRNRRRPSLQPGLLLYPGGCCVEDGVSGGADDWNSDVVLFEQYVGLVAGHGSIGHMRPVSFPVELIVDHSFRGR